MEGQTLSTSDGLRAQSNFKVLIPVAVYVIASADRGGGVPQGVGVLLGVSIHWTGKEGI